MIVWPGVTGTEKPYEPFVVVFTMQLVGEVGIVGEVVTQASVTGAPAESWTVPVIVTVGFVVDDGAGVGVCGGSVRSGVGAPVGARVRVGVAEPAAGS